jgi:DNA-binding CsgD family transcriptional regulator/tetratricopeptide (TPR) repeat protein
VPVVTADRQRRAGEPAGSLALAPRQAILVAMTAALTSPTFVGRTEELARLAAAWDRAAAGTPTALLVGGEAGVGKTRLVGELVAAVRRAGGAVLVGGCVELGGEGVPFAPLIEALRSLARDLDEPGLARMVPDQARAELARLLPELGPSPGPDPVGSPGGPDPVGSAPGSGAAGPTRGPGAGAPEPHPPMGGPPTGRVAATGTQGERLSTAPSGAGATPSGAGATPMGTGATGSDRLSTTPGLWSEQGRLFELLLGLLERLGDERPALLVVEDLHWADRSTRDLLAFLHRNLRHGRLLLVMTYRSDELHRRHPLRPFLAELDRGRRVERLELERFGPAEVAAQLAGIQGAPAPAELVERIHARSGGNAFFVEELAASAGADGDLPPSLRDTLLARIELLAEPTQQVLRVAAAAGARVEHDLLAETAALGEAELLDGLREAVSAHVLLVDAGEGSYGFRHALVKEAVYAELLPGERTRLHARFAAALAARDGAGDPGLAAELAWHWYAAHDLERALPAAIEAGKAAERAYAFAEAQRQFERALELWERTAAPPPEEVGLDKAELLARAGEAAANTGASERAVALVRSALAEIDPVRDPLRAAQLTERLAFHLRIAGRPGAFEAYQEAVRLVPPGPSEERARALAGLGQALMLRARFAEAASLCEEAIAVARAVGDRQVEGHALNTLGTAIVRLDKIDRGLALLEEARRLAVELGAAKDEARACVNLSDILDDLGRLEEAVAVAGAGMEVASATGLRRTFGAFLAGNAAASLYHLGRWAETVQLTDAYLQLGSDEDLNMVTLRQGRAVLDAGRGDFASALAHVRAARRLSGDMFIAVQYPPVLAAAEAEVAAWQGRLEDAAATVAGGLAALQGPLTDLRACMLLALGLRVEAERVALAAARHDDDTVADARLVAEELLRWAQGTLDGSEVAWKRAVLATCEAEAARVRGEGDPEGWLAAVAAWEEAGYPYHLAVARWRAAEALLARRGDRNQAGELLRQGHATAAGIGAEPLRRELERLARLGRVELRREAAATERDGAPVGGSAPPPGAELGLTARELEVLVLVAEGRSNRQVAEVLFISRKTASVHVSNILAKLGVASRVEAAAVAHRLGLL